MILSKDMVADQPLHTAILIVWVPPILLSTAAITFAGLALRHFMLRRLSFAAHLNSSNAALTLSRYLRLMTMAALQMVWSITITSYALAFTSMTLQIRPWTTWDDVHSDWLRVDAFPDIFATPFLRNVVVYTNFHLPFCSVLLLRQGCHRMGQRQSPSFHQLRQSQEER